MPKNPTGSEYLKSLLGISDDKSVESYLKSTQPKSIKPIEAPTETDSLVTPDSCKNAQDKYKNAEAVLESARLEAVKSCGNKDIAEVETGFEFEGGRKSRRRLRSTTRSKKRHSTRRRRRRRSIRHN